MVDTVPTTALTNADILPGATEIVTGAAPVTADVNVRLYAITTGGTAGTETINLPTPDLPLDDWLNPAILGCRIAFYVAAQTDPADVVNLSIDFGQITVYGKYNHNSTCQKVNGGGVILDYVGAMACFVWVGDKWQIDLAATDASGGSGFDNQPVNVVGTSIDLTSVAIRLNDLPTSDPGSPNSLWNDSGTLKISAG